MLTKYLEEIGLSDKEAVIYLALLAVEHASVLDLAKTTKIIRTTVYAVLESLEKKGLVSEIQVGKKTRYYAEPPERLETFVERQKMLYEERARRIKEMIPEIRSVQRETGERPIVYYHEGKEGILSSMEELYESGERGGEACLFYSRDLIDEVFVQQELKKLRDIRRTKNIHAKAIYTWEKGEMPSDETSERHKIDPKKYPIACDISIYRDKVKINTLGKALAGITIRSKDVANTLQTLFRLALERVKEK